MLPGWIGLEGVGSLSAIDCLGFGLTVGIAGILGDLAESLLKRDAGRKDSSDWLARFLRNDVMHPISSFVSSGEDVKLLAYQVAQARMLVDQAVDALRRRYAVPDPDV